MRRRLQKYGGNIIAVEEVPPEETHQYGVVSIGKDEAIRSRSQAWSKSRRKGTAPSTSIISGRYPGPGNLQDPGKRRRRGAGGEIQLTDGMKTLAKAQVFTATRFRRRDLRYGPKLGFLMANAAFALANPELAGPYKAELKKPDG